MAECAGDCCGDGISKKERDDRLRAKSVDPNKFDEWLKSIGLDPAEVNQHFANGLDSFLKYLESKMSDITLASLQESMAKIFNNFPKDMNPALSPRFFALDVFIGFYKGKSAQDAVFDAALALAAVMTSVILPMTSRFTAARVTIPSPAA